jgi:hypothetical protein
MLFLYGDTHGTQQNGRLPIGRVHGAMHIRKYTGGAVYSYLVSLGRFTLNYTLPFPRGFSSQSCTPAHLGVGKDQSIDEYPRRGWTNE